MKIVIKYVLFPFFLIALLVGYQLYQVMSNVNEMRLAELKKWSDGNEARTQQVTDFLRYCVDKPKEKELSVYECAEKYGSKELAQFIKNVNKTHNSKTVPMPLT